MPNILCSGKVASNKVRELMKKFPYGLPISRAKLLEGLHKEGAMSARAVQLAKEIGEDDMVVPAHLLLPVAFSAHKKYIQPNCLDVQFKKQSGFF